MLIGMSEDSSYLLEHGQIVNLPSHHTQSKVKRKRGFYLTNFALLSARLVLLTGKKEEKLIQVHACYHYSKDMVYLENL